MENLDYESIEHGRQIELSCFSHSNHGENIKKNQFLLFTLSLFDDATRCKLC